MNWQIDRWKRWKDIDRQTDVQWIDRKKWSDTPEISYCRVNLNKLTAFQFLIFSALQNIFLFNILNKLEIKPDVHCHIPRTSIILLLSSPHYTFYNLLNCWCAHSDSAIGSKSKRVLGLLQRMPSLWFIYQGRLGTHCITSERGSLDRISQSQ